MINTRLLVCLSTFAYALLIFSYPPSFYNDDSLFFVNGILNFSVLDFSPHFPGYPTLVILGKFINLFLDDAKNSLFILTASCAILLPAILYLYVKKLKDENSAFIVFILSISSVYLLNISLSMLSESVGLFFLFLSLYTLEIKKYKISGVLLAFSFFARPSYIVLFLAEFIYLALFKKEVLKSVFVSFLATSLLFLVFIFASHGMLYIYEAKRFITGHFSIWGIGQNTQKNWFMHFFNFVNIPFIFLFFCFYKYEKNFTLLYMMFCAYFVWLINAQNPDNLRHFIPLVLFANIFLSSVLVRKKVILTIIFCFNIFVVHSYKEKISPIDQIIRYIKDENKIVISNRSIEILKNGLKNRVFDNYYTHTAQYYRQNQKSYLITTRKPKTKPYKIFYGRFLGEHTFYLVN